jgi:hypothetical protein
MSIARRVMTLCTALFFESYECPRRRIMQAEFNSVSWNAVTTV